MSTPCRSEGAVVVALLGLTLAVKLVVAFQWGVLADEAYYALWATRPALGYYDQPPLIAWVLRPIIGLRSDGLLRLPAALAGLVGAWAVLSLHRDRVFGAMWWMGCIPLAWLTGFMTPDALLLACWAGCLAAASRGGRWWVLAGALGALAGLSKYSGLAVFPLCWWASGDRGRHVWVGGAVWVGLYLPHLGWLAANEWVSVAFQATEGLLHPNAPGMVGPVLVLLQQLALLNPLGLAAVLWVWSLPTPDRVTRLAWWTSAPVGLFFLVASVGGPPEAHWLAPCWVGAGVLLARSTGRLARLAWAAAGVGAFFSAVLLAHGTWGVFRIPLDPADRLREGRVVAEGVGTWALPEGVGWHEDGVERAQPVRTERYQEAALIWWYTGVQTARHRGCGRRDQFDLWEEPLPADYLFVRPTRGGPLTCAGPVRSRHPVVGQTLEGRVVGRWDLFEVGP